MQKERFFLCKAPLFYKISLFCRFRHESWPMLSLYVYGPVNYGCQIQLFLLQLFYAGPFRFSLLYNFIKMGIWSDEFVVKKQV